MVVGHPRVGEGGHRDEIRDIVTCVDTLRDLYPPLDPTGEREGGLVPNTAPGIATTPSSDETKFANRRGRGNPSEPP